MLAQRAVQFADVRVVARFDGADGVPGPVVHAQPAPHDRRQLSIVRPDGYIGLVAKADDWTAATAWLERLERP